MISTLLSGQTLAVIRCRRCVGPATACAGRRTLGHQISHTVVGELLKAQKFSLQANRKTHEGADNLDRDARFGFINEAITTAMTQHQPVISVDTKKKELVGDFKNAGREWRPQGSPEDMRVHDFLIKELGRGVPLELMTWRPTQAGWTSVSTMIRRRRRADDPTMVARSWPRSLFRRPALADHRRWRRQQRLACALMET
jgi:Rhodopirellula transposase DDE domain